jgi:hypothetical protein
VAGGRAARVPDRPGGVPPSRDAGGDPLPPDRVRPGLELSGGNRASLFTSYAEAVSVRTQDAGEFRSLLQTALAIDPDRVEHLRLANRIAQRRARWLLDRIDQLFLEPDAAAPAAGGM